MREKDERPVIAIHPAICILQIKSIFVRTYKIFQILVRESYREKHSLRVTLSYHLSHFFPLSLPLLHNLSILSLAHLLHFCFYFYFNFQILRNSSFNTCS
ncbi:hypothetical protein L1887_12125 [Cichorium endivia]|nr:hypothetical protein L1887_12125 [Cichorium endivia]